MTATATEVKNHFGEYMEKARQEPVVVEKTGRPYVVMLHPDEYAYLRSLEDAYWIARADEAKKSGTIGAQETTDYLEERFHAK